LKNIDLSQKLDQILEILQTREAPKPLNFTEACTYLGVSKQTLYGLTSRNRIKHYKPAGKFLYFRKEDLDAFLLRNPIKTREEIQANAKGG